MVSEVEKKISEISKLCRKYKMARLWLFGSALDPKKFTEQSDIDLLYEFDDGGEYDENMHYAALWSDMLDELRTLFGREVQLIGNGPFKNPYFRATVEATKKLIYDKDTEKLPV